MTRTSVSLVAATIAGLVIGLVGGFVQAHRFIWTFDGRYLVVPWGVVIVVVVLLVTIRGAAKLVHRRSAGWFVLAGWLVMTFFLATETPAGDIAVSSGVRQWGYVLGGAVFGSALATLPPRSFASMGSTRSDVRAGAGRAGEPSGLA